MYRPSTKIKIASAYNYGGYPNTQFIKKVDFGLKTDQLSKNALNDIHAWSMNSWHDACGYITWLCKHLTTPSLPHTHHATHTHPHRIFKISQYLIWASMFAHPFPLPHAFAAYFYSGADFEAIFFRSWFHLRFWVVWITHPPSAASQPQLWLAYSGAGLYTPVIWTGGRDGLKV